MARLQILELPEGADDSRPPYVLVVDECAPQRIIIGMDHGPVRNYWHEVAGEIGARGVIVTAETVEIPANDVSAEFREGLHESVAELYESARDSLATSITPRIQEVEGKLSESETLGHKLLQRGEIAEAKLRSYVERSRRRDFERMDVITDALGFDRLRDWGEIVEAIAAQRKAGEPDGGHRFGVPGYLDPQRCAQCGIDRGSWYLQRDQRTCGTVQAERESGHEFRPIGERGDLACLRCGLPRVEWVARRDVPSCDAAGETKGTD